MAGRSRPKSDRSKSERKSGDNRRGRSRGGGSDWDGVASWYDGWVGADGSHYHRTVALPTTLDLLALAPGERVLDLGAGQGVLAPHVKRAGAHYLGIETSPRLVEMARRRHGDHGTFLQGDARALPTRVESGGADAAVFLFSIRDIDPLSAALAEAARALRPGGRLVIFMVHPCFGIPRQSGWTFDPKRKLASRRIDSYLQPLAVPMKDSTRSFHRPLQVYFESLFAAGFSLERFVELPDDEAWCRKQKRPFNPEIPLFLAMRAVRRRPALD